MIGQAEDMKLDLECFAQEAADKVAQLWSARGSAPLSVDQEHELVDSIWECLLPRNSAEAQSEERILMHNT